MAAFGLSAKAPEGERVAVVQHACGIAREWLEIARCHHEAMCEKWGYDYLVSHDRTAPWRHPVWERVSMIRKAVEQGYQYVIYLDADTVWLGDHSLHLPFEQFAAVRHVHANAAMDHFNIGVLLCRNVTTLDCDVWWREPSERHQWREQWAFRNLVKRGRFHCEEIGLEFNSTFDSPYRVPEEKIHVAAWHNVGGDRGARMGEWMANRGLRRT